MDVQGRHFWLCEISVSGITSMRSHEFFFARNLQIEASYLSALAYQETTVRDNRFTTVFRLTPVWLKGQSLWINSANSGSLGSFPYGLYTGFMDSIYIWFLYPLIYIIDRLIDRQVDTLTIERQEDRQTHKLINQLKTEISKSIIWKGIQLWLLIPWTD